MKIRAVMLRILLLSSLVLVISYSPKVRTAGAGARGMDVKRPKESLQEEQPNEEFAEAVSAMLINT